MCGNKYPYHLPDMRRIVSLGLSAFRYQRGRSCRANGDAVALELRRRVLGGVAGPTRTPLLKRKKKALKI